MYKNKSELRFSIAAVLVSLAVAVFVSNISVGIAAGLVLGTILSVIGFAHYEVLVHAMIVLLPMQSAMPYSFDKLGTLNPFNLLAAAMVTVWIVTAIVRHERLVHNSWMSWVIIIFCLISIGAYLNSYRFIGSEYVDLQLNALKRWLSPILLFFPIANGKFSRPAIKRMVGTAVIMIAVISLWTLKDYIDTGFQEISIDTRIAGPFGPGAENDLAAFFVFYPIILLTIAFLEKRFVFKVALCGLFALSMIPMLFSLSRGGYIGMIAVLFFIAAVRFRWMLILVLVGTIGYESWAPGVVQQRLQDTRVVSNELVGGRVPAPRELERTLETSSAQRVRIWRGALNIVKSHPLTGIGFNVFPVAIPKYANMEWGMDAHNMYLRVAAELGLIGLFFFVLLLLIPFYSMWRVYKTSRDRFIQGWMLGAMACICGIIVVNIFGSRFAREELVGIYWVLVALTYAYIYLRRERWQRIELERQCRSEQSDHAQRVRQPAVFLPIFSRHA